MKSKNKYLLFPIFILLFLLLPTIFLLFAESHFSLSSINFGVLQPMGEVAYKQQGLFIHCVILMLIVVVPTIILTFIFAFKYHHTKKADYTPEWSHNSTLEMVWWGIPMIIVAVLAFLTWKSSYELDPYKPLESDVKPIRIQVVSLSWKWLFIYPEYGIATINFIQFPIDTPINFEITADSAMNSFMIPQLGGQIYAMNGMQTKLHLMANHIKEYRGIAANYNGSGFSGMSFIAKASSKEEFESWIKQAKSGKNKLDWEKYQTISQPSENEKKQIFSSVSGNIYMNIINKYMHPGHGLHANTETNKHTEHNH